MNILQINTVINDNPVGNICDAIGNKLIEKGHLSTIAYGRGSAVTQSKTIKIGDAYSVLRHVAYTRIADKHAMASTSATKRLVRQIMELKPDIVHLHNLHGYYINIAVLFEALYKIGVPIVLTMHDCWSITGHCAYFTDVGCDKWKTKCYDCPKIGSYPKSWYDNSAANYHMKKELLSYANLSVVAVSKWLKNIAQQSYLQHHPVYTIYNGIDTSIFKPKKALNTDNRILGIANVWTEEKGISDYIALRQALPSEFNITLVGVNAKLAKRMPQGITAMPHIYNREQLATLINSSMALLSLSKGESFGMTPIEAMACGVPAIVYDNTAQPELIAEDVTGYVVPTGDIHAVANALSKIANTGNEKYASSCIARVKDRFDINTCTDSYIKLYEHILSK